MHHYLKGKCYSAGRVISVTVFAPPPSPNQEVTGTQRWDAGSTALQPHQHSTFRCVSPLPLISCVALLQFTIGCWVLSFGWVPSSRGWITIPPYFLKVGRMQVVSSLHSSTASGYALLRCFKSKVSRALHCSNAVLIHTHQATASLC